MMAWPLTTIGEQFEVQLGKMLDIARNVGELKPYLGNRAVQWGKIDISSVGYVPLTRSDLRRFRLRNGDLLVCEGGEVGRGAIWREQLPECYFQKALHRLRPKDGYDVRLMLGLLEYWSSIGMFTDYVTQTSIAHLPRDRFIQMPLPLPSAAEQHRIGDALQDIDNMIGTLGRAISKKNAIKQGMQQQLLTGKTRLPGFTGSWCSVQLREVLSVRHGKIQKQVENPRGKYPILATGGQIGWADRPLYSKPSVLIGRKGTIDKPQFQATPFWTVDTLFYTEIFSTVDPRYIYYVFLTVDWKSMNEASGVPSLSSTRIESIEVQIPGVEEQQAIRSVLDDVEADIRVLRARLDKANAVKWGMMQQLLTGRTRLPAEKSVA